MIIIPMRDLKDTVEIERKCKESNGPVFVTKNGYGRLVVMDIDFYEKYLSEIFEAKLIKEGLEDFNNGKVAKGDDVKQRMMEKYGR